ncbi:MAG: DNA mismatch repair endonuclease MutL [Chloroflexi bacterium]|nr:MAG: DNA mismatch repair endonuclease MutL [Chloroflexota bacterium]
MPIQILKDEVASQIAAGEVVERPASVVKELAENALDARASQITIQISDAGRRLIEIADDGEGIPAGEMELAVARHATSKLRSAEDLFRIQTLGFRGEALASIASVSRFTLISRARDAETGARLRVEDGRCTPPEPVGVPVGTVVRVEELFYNVPARLKFLKRDLTERQQIDALVTRYALAYPAVRFHLFHDGRAVLQTTGRGDRREVLAGLYGITITRQMLEVSFEEEHLRVSGFISPVALTRSNRKEITFFVNGRWVQDSSLAAALLQAYHTLLMVGRYPLAALFVELDAEEVDVNVHPAKAEVRFRSPDRVFSGVQRAVRRALLAYSPVPPVSSNTWQSQLPTRSIDPGWEMPRDVARDPAYGAGGSRTAGWGLPTDQGDWPDEIAPGETAAPEHPDEETDGRTVQPAEGQPAAAAARVGPVEQGELAAGTLPLLRLIGQVGQTYLVAEGPDGLYLIDQHAAHERVLFERFMRQRGGPIPAQSLLEPATIHLPPASASLLQSQLGVLDELGFAIEPFGPNTFRVRAIPAVLIGTNPEAAVRVVVEDFEEDESPLQAEIEARLIARVCKRAAVKAGQTLSIEEQRALLRELETCRSPRTCPHGRPTMIHLSVDLLERQFGRRGGR